MIQPWFVGLWLVITCCNATRIINNNRLYHQQLRNSTYRPTARGGLHPPVVSTCRGLHPRPKAFTLVMKYGEIYLEPSGTPGVMAARWLPQPVHIFDPVDDHDPVMRPTSHGKREQLGRDSHGWIHLDTLKFLELESESCRFFQVMISRGYGNSYSYTWPSGKDLKHVKKNTTI